MDYEAVLAQVLALLQREGRLSYRVLKRRFGVDDDLLEDLRRFLKKNILSQDVEAGRIRISQLGNSGWRSSRASTSRIAFLLSVTPL